MKSFIFHNRFLAALLLSISTLIFSCTGPVPMVVNNLDRQVDSVLSLMTLNEKIGQMTLYTSDMDQTGAFVRKEYEEDIKYGRVGSIFNAYGADYTRKLQDLAIKNTRLRIPLLFGYDVIHGHRTIFPVPLAEASSWDMKSIEHAARIAAIEASAEGLHWTFAPMCDIARDPRWGRIVEGSGEDPFLGSEIARARVRGFQGNNLGDVNTVVACVKHYAAYGAAQAGRDYHSTDMSQRLLREVYLPPYKAAIDEGALTVMSSFNDLDGIPATANKFLLTDVLRGEWGFDGFVVTDYNSIGELINHGVAADQAEAAAISLKAGIDMDMQAGIYPATLSNLVDNQLVSEESINIAVRRILKVKFQLGLFEDPYKYCSTEREKNLLMTPGHQEAARDMARKSFVLLKNEKQLLPLNKNLKRIAVVGPLADSRQDLIGSWSAAGDWSKAVTLLEGIRAAVPQAQVQYAKGCEITGTSTDNIKQAVEVAKSADVVILAVGEAAWMSGEAASRSDIGLPGVQQTLVEAMYKTGKPIVVVLMNGRPLTIKWIDSHIPAILETWFAGTQAGNAIADVLFGDYNPSGKLPVTFPDNLGQVPVYYSMRNTGRPFEAANKYTSKYLDGPNEPLYVFGYGLSYTKFEYSPLLLDKNILTENDTISISVIVKNTGELAGEEVVQLYVHDKVASVAPPVKTLKGFKKIRIDAGEEKIVQFVLTPADLAFYRADMTYGWEKGAFRIDVGTNSRDVVSAEFNLQ
ncbi:MAG: beta-glucosidase BglX [Bacteroidales bacterium]|nr:beta-glucosidase BglX [Bacteroidales bacterium]